MATVYLAQDLKHKRRVAIKVVRPELAAVLGPERFLREIEITAQLNHPHILPLLDSGEAGGFLYYAMPYAEGESLRERLLREKQLPIEDAIQIAREVADALDYAHRQGLVHRDIKPENILLQERHAVVADFGIARAISLAGGERLTATGVAVGTPEYMSPEQASGRGELDGRSDIYALGCVVHEMIAGQPPFTGATADAVLRQHLTARPSTVTVIRDGVPASVATAIERSLAKAPADRYATASTFGETLGVVPARTTSGAVGARRRRQVTVRLVGGTFAILATATAVAIIGRAILSPSPQPSATRRQLTFSGDVTLATLSPDGQFLAYVAQPRDMQQILVQDLAGGSPDTLATLGYVLTLEWSPDGTELLVGSSGQGAFVLPRLGGTRRQLSLPPQFGVNVHAYWLPDGSRVSLHTNASRQVLVMDLATGDSVSMPVSGAYTWLNEGSWSADGRTFAVVTVSTDPAGWAIRAVSLGGGTQVVAEENSVPLGSPRWSPHGDALLYARGTDAIWRVPVSPRTGRRRGAPHEVLRDLEMLPRPERPPHFGLTRDGNRVAYAKGRRFSNLWMVEPAAAEAEPSLVKLSSGTTLRWSPVVSPDGRWIAFAQEARDSAEIFRMPLEGGAASQLTFGAGILPRSEIAWSPDGNQIAFVSLRAGRGQVWVAGVNDGRMRALDRTRASVRWGHLTWAPGSKVAYLGAAHRNILLVDPASGEERGLLVDTTAGWVFSPRYSPDGARLAVNWNRSSPGSDFATWIFDLQAGSSRKLRTFSEFPRGWSSDGRYVYLQWPSSKRAVLRVDATGSHPAQPVLDLPWREAECSPVGPRRPNAFVCAAFDFVSDAWMIENAGPGIL